jgi:D-3-phosphoglycerate dehydrogenase
VPHFHCAHSLHDSGILPVRVRLAYDAQWSIRPAMKFRVFLTGSGLAQAGLVLLQEAGCDLLQGAPTDSTSDIVKKVTDFNPHALIVRQGSISSAVMDACGDLKVICKHGTGVDNIDIDAASDRNIPVMYTPDANFECVAEHTLALMLALIRHVPQQDHLIRQGEFNKAFFSGQELLGKTLGLVGFGRIARRLGELVEPFRMKVLAYHPSCTKELLPAHISKTSSIESVFSNSDFVSLHLPLTEETRGMVDGEMLSIMRPTAFLINTARGPLVKEKDLIGALTCGTIKGAALDTFESEPPGSKNPLYDLPSVVLTMHTAGNSDASLTNMATTSASNVLAILRNERVDERVVVNKDVLGEK